MRRHEQGTALIVVTAMALLAMALWALAYGAVLDAARAEKILRARQAREASVTRALVAAIRLLETGAPPHDLLQCIATTDDGERTYHCTVTYSRGEDVDTWEVAARPSPRSDLLRLPPLPETFQKEAATRAEVDKTSSKTE